MRNLDRNPLDSAAPALFAAHSPRSAMGIELRRGDAQLRLQEMAAAEVDVRKRETALDALEDRVARIEASRQLNVDYLIRFGVTAAVRHAFRQTLEEVAATGRLSLREAAHVARLRHAANAPLPS